MSRAGVNPFVELMLFTVLISLAFTGAFVASWVAYFWGDGDEERLVFCCAVEVFALPLLLGSVQAIRCRQSCLLLLRFSSIPLFFVLPLRNALSHLDQFPPYIEWASRRSCREDGSSS